MLVLSSSYNYTYQIQFTSNAIAIRNGTYKDDIWSEWEYVTAPLIPGTEYRTIEKYYGFPVYTKLIYAGDLNSGEYSMIDPGIPISQYNSKLIRCEGQYTSASGQKQLTQGVNIYSCWVPSDPAYYLGVQQEDPDGVDDVYVRIWYTR